MFKVITGEGGGATAMFKVMEGGEGRSPVQDDKRG